MNDQFSLDDVKGVGAPRVAPLAEARSASPRPGYPEAAQVGDGKEPHLLDYLRVLHKRRWTAATAFLFVVGIVTVYTFTATPIYEARTRLLIEADNPNVVSFKEVIDEDQTKADYYQTQYSILKSRILARKTIEALKMWHHPEVADPKGAPESQAAATAADETAAQSRAIDRFLSRLTVAPIRNSRLVDVNYRSPDPVVAERILNTLARAYIEQHLEYKLMASKEATDWLGQRLGEQRKQVESAESALQRYREQNDAISLEDRENIVVQKLADLNAAVTRAKTVRIEKEALYNQLRAIQADQVALDTFPAVLSNSYIQQQKADLTSLQSQLAQASEKLGDRHPDIIRLKSAVQSAQLKLSAEIAKIVQAVRNEYESAHAQENSMVAALEAQKREALGMNRRAIEYGVLKRDVESNQQIYDSLLQRAKETGVSSELRTSNVRVVDPAERPQGPVSPRPALNLLLAVLGGAIFAGGLAFFFEYLDNRIKSPDEIKAYLRLPALGIVPSIHPKALNGSQPLINNGVPANFVEAFRTLRTNVLFSSADEGTRSIVVTSTGPSEGKTLVSTNLALALAQSGHRVLLIDADLRRPAAHTRFAIPAEPGLSNLMVGNARASDSVRNTSVPGLWLLPAGRIPPNPLELLGSKRFKDFLHSLSEHFDWIVVDSPPVMAVSDAAVVAHACSGVLFVVGSEMANRHAAQAAIEQLETARVRFIGAVLNRVDLERQSYYYSHYYRREYSNYYTRQAS